MRLGESDSIRSGNPRACALHWRVPSSGLLNGLTRLRLPIGQEVPDINVGFQFREFFIIQAAFGCIAIGNFDPRKIVPGKVQRQQAIGKRNTCE